MHAVTKPLSALALTLAVLSATACTGSIDQNPTRGQPTGGSSAGGQGTGGSGVVPPTTALKP
jgi:hypothetical protein